MNGIAGISACEKSKGVGNIAIIFLFASVKNGIARYYAK